MWSDYDLDQRDTAISEAIFQLGEDLGYAWNAPAAYSWFSRLCLGVESEWKAIADYFRAYDVAGVDVDSLATPGTIERDAVLHAAGHFLGVAQMRQQERQEHEQFATQDEEMEGAER